MKTEKKVYSRDGNNGFQDFRTGDSFRRPFRAPWISRRFKEDEIKIHSLDPSSALIALTFRDCPSVRSFVINERVYVRLFLFLLESVFVRKCLNLYISTCRSILDEYFYEDVFHLDVYCSCCVNYFSAKWNNFVSKSHVDNVTLTRDVSSKAYQERRCVTKYSVLELEEVKIRVTSRNDTDQ